METKSLVRILKALNQITSDDSTRGGLIYVHAATATRLEATDGLRLMRVDLTADHGLALGYYGDQQVKLLAAGGAVQPVTIDYRWPDTDQVFPREGENDKSCAALTVDPWLLADTVDAVAKALGAKRNEKGHVEVKFFDAFSPVRITGTREGVTVSALLMPKR